MSYQYLVSNQSNLPRAEIVTIVDGDHVWFESESMKVFLEKGGLFEDWTRPFSIVIVSDANLTDGIKHQDYTSKGERKYYFNEPDRDTDIWKELYLTGEVTRTFEEVKAMIGERV